MTSWCVEEYQSWVADGCPLNLSVVTLKMSETFFNYPIKSPLTSIVKEINNLPNLEVIDVSGNAITIIPDEIGELKHLRVLHLSSNNLTELPRSISGLDLTRFSCSYNNITTLPCFDYMKNLKWFIVCKNNIESIFLDVSVLPKLEVVDISRNPIRKINHHLLSLVGDKYMYCDVV
jgi:Leucine-rich repeat (LRR) protein